jgi:hypothetical protein
VTDEERRVWEMVGRCADNVTDDQGRFEHKNFIEEIAATIDEMPVHARARVDRMTAHSLATGFISRRNPKPRAQGSMYRDDAILPLGDGRRVWMRDATDDDLIRWARLSTANLARVAQAEGARQQYAADRIGALRDHPDLPLSEIERRYFGYEPEAGENNDPDDGDEF